MGKSSKAPAPPDPMATAQAQSQFNMQNARAQQRMNSTNQVTPYGTLSYRNLGADWASRHTDDLQRRFNEGTYTPLANDGNFDWNTEYNAALNWAGNPYQDRWESTATLDPRIQELFESAVANLQKPLDLSNQAVEDRIAQLGQSRLDPVWNQRQAATETQLANQGIRPGSEAYTNAMRQFDYGRNDAYNNLALTARSQALQEMLAQREVPLNELNTLLGGGQASTSSFGNTPQVQIAPVDYTGAVNNAYQGQMQGFAAKQQQNNSNMQGLASLGSAAMMLFALSDKRAKTDIQEVGKLNNGLPVYSYRYKGSPLQQIGLMAQDVEKSRPEAVATRPDGLKAVNYAEAVR